MQKSLKTIKTSFPQSLRLSQPQTAAFCLLYTSGYASKGAAGMVHTVVILEENHVVAAENRSLKHTLHELFREAEEIHFVFYLDYLCHVIV